MSERFRAFFLIAGLVLLAGLGHKPTAFAQTSNNPIPRFVAIDRSVANMRSGPGRQYPIQWVYKRAGLPLKVVDENGPWRRVVDPDGAEGWMHVRLLTGRRTVLLKGEPGAITRKLYQKPSATSAVRVTAESGVTARLMACEKLWCELRIENVRAWIETRHLWGIFPGEEIG